MSETLLPTERSPDKLEDRKRTRAFIALFLIEMWERFGYYGMAVLLVLFLKETLGFSDVRANLTWGAFGAMVYAVPTVGGWIGDRILGARRTTLLGAIVLGLGYAMMAVPWEFWLPKGSTYGDLATPLLFFSLGLIAAGNGLFKANPNNLVSRLYEKDPSKLDGAFTMYYMSINIGAAISQFGVPLIRSHSEDWFGVPLKYGWYLGFAVCALGLVFGIAQYRIQRKTLDHVGSEPDFKPLNKGHLFIVLVGTLLVAGLIALIIQNLAVAKIVVWAAGAILLALFAWLIAKGGKAERAGLIAMLLLTAEGILFFIFYQQMSTSLTLFALRNVDLNFYGYMVPPEQFQVLNPLWIAVLSPLLAWLYAGLGKRDRDPSVAAKFAVGFVMVAVGFFLYGISGHFAVAGMVSAWWMIWGYFFQSFGELLISGLGLAMVSRYVGPSLRGLMMGAWLLSTGLAQYMGSIVANYAAVPQSVTNPLETLPLYTNLFMKLGYVALVGVLVALVILPLLKRLDKASKQPHPEVAAPQFE